MEAAIRGSDMKPALPMKLLIFLWERHLAAMVSWLEATPTMAELHYRIPEIRVINPET
jgi:hypothetical protein